MTRRFLAVFVASLTVAAVALAALNAAPPDAELSFPKATDSTIFWPLDHAWRWTIQRSPPSPSGRNHLALFIRVKHFSHDEAADSQLLAERTPVAAGAADSKLSVGMFANAKVDKTAEASVQLLDLAELGEVPAGEPRYRLIVRWESGGARLRLLPDESAVKPGRLAGQFNVERPTWKNGEMFLQRLVFKDDRGHNVYDVVARARPAKPDGGSGPPVDD